MSWLKLEEAGYAGGCGDVSDPTVSVVVHSFNAAHTIEQALESVIGQQTSFEVEIVVWDDASDDETVAIAKDLLEGQDRPWRVMVSATNLYSLGKSPMLRSAAEARGDFLARLDGDDYWCDKRKLQRQWDLFMSHPKAVLCCTGYQLVDESGQTIEIAPLPADGPAIDYEMLRSGNYVCHSSAMYRRRILDCLPSSWEGLAVRDYALWGYAAVGTEILVDPSLMTAYRQHRESAWRSKTQQERTGDEIAAVAWLSDNVPVAQERLHWRMRRIEIEQWARNQGMRVGPNENGDESVRDIALLFDRLSYATGRAVQLTQRVQDLQADDARSTQRAQALQAEIGELSARLIHAQASAETLRDQLTEVQDRVNSIIHSRSWRLTAPLRSLRLFPGTGRHVNDE